MGVIGELTIDPWREVVGQERAVARLRAASARPVHAYLLVGPAGSGKRSLARAFAAQLLADAADAADASAAPSRPVAPLVPSGNGRRGWPWPSGTRIS